MNAPSEEKFRKIRCENAVFKEKVRACKYSDLVLKSAGFKLNKLMNGDVEEEFLVFEGEDLNSLKQMKEALELAEPIVPQLDRDLKVYRVNAGSQLANFDLSDDFYNLSIDEIRKEQKLREEALEKQGMLRTKAMRERDEKLELRMYNYCLIRVRFPNDFMIEAMFKSREKLSDLYSFVAECLENASMPFELFGHSMRKGVENDCTLAEAGLAPAAVLNFKWNEEAVKEAARFGLDTSLYLNKHLITKSLDLN